MGKLHYSESGALTREGLSHLILSANTQVLTLQLRRSARLMAETAVETAALS